MASRPPGKIEQQRSDQIIEVQGLTKKYGQTTAVDGVSFGVKQGEIFCLLGPNGAGKTTTIRMLTTLASITSGKAMVAGFDVSKNPASVRSSIGLVPQELTADDELTGRENLLFAARLYHLPDDQSRVRIGEMLSLIDLESAAERKVKTYSGGMRRRLQLAMGLIHSPRILFLDEPTIGLDIQTRKKVHEYIRGLNREQGLTVFMTTHYLEEADELSQRIGIIDEGRIKALNSPSALKSEMGTQILILQVSASGENLTDFLKSVPDVTEVTKRGPGLYEVGLSKVEDAIPVIVDGTVRRRLRILDLSVVKPSLEQVFLQITGHSLRDSEALSNVYGQKLQIERMK